VHVCNALAFLKLRETSGLSTPTQQGETIAINPPSPPLVLFYSQV